MFSGLWSISSLVVVMTLLAAAYYIYERRGVSTREAALIASLAALAGLSRVPFGGFPGIQPTTFMVIISGAVFGPGAGFMVGSLSAVVSNMILGQGPWTPWQMLAWGLAGLFGGLLRRFTVANIESEEDIAGEDYEEGEPKRRDLFQFSKTGKAVFIVSAFFWGFIFGWFMNTWHWLTFVYPHTWQTFFLTHLSSAWFDVLHAVSNAVFMAVAGGEMIKILNRFQRRLHFKTKVY